MSDLVAALTTESRWIAPSALLGILAALAVLRNADLDRRARITAAMSAFSGVFIAVMAFGHLLAVTLLALDGSLRASPIVVYAIGVALIVPALFVAAHGLRFADDAATRRTTLIVHAVLVAALLLSGPRNAPLAVPSLLAIAWTVHRRPIAGRLIVVLAIATAILLLVGSIRFFLFGGSFEEFSGLEGGS